MFKRGELLLIPYPFTDLSSQKRRPVLALTLPDSQGDFIALPVTSRGYHKHSIALSKQLKTGKLPKPSWVRIDHVITLNHALVIKSFATCSEELVNEAIAGLCQHLREETQ